MGEAKRRAAARIRQEEALANVDIPRLAAAIRKYAMAASEKLGGDCYIHAALAQAILDRLGVESAIKVGHAAFRVGEGGSDVILHAPAPGMVPQPGGLAFHVWLQVGYYLLDITAYQLRQKAAHLDDLDGGKTTVTWCPDYLFVPRKSVSSLKDVTQLHAGLYYYHEEPAVADKVISTASELDSDDVEVAWTLYQNEGIQVVGPNDVLRLQHRQP